MQSITKNRIGLGLILVLNIFPIFLWFFMKSFGARFGDTFSTLTSIGQISGLIGIVLFSIVIILSSRLHFLEDSFGSLDRIYNIHHILGTLAFVSFLIHPLALAIRFVPASFDNAIQFFIPGKDLVMNFGILALFLMMLILVITFFARWKYQYIKFSHKILGVAFLFGVAHTFFVSSDISQDIFLKIYILGIVSLAIVSYSYKTIFGKYFVKKFTYIIDAVNILNGNTTEVIMSPKGKIMNYIPGQFLFVSFVDSAVTKESHPFSISSVPGENKIRITIKSLGDWTSGVKNLKAGSIAKIDGPFGGFYYTKTKNKKQIWIAGGIGVAPFLGMIRDLKLNKRNDLVVDFYYTVKTESEIVFKEEIESIARELPNFKFIPFISNERGMLNIDIIKQTITDIGERDVFMCGPHSMMNALTNQFVSVGIPKKRIYTEAFRLL